MGNSLMEAMILQSPAVIVFIDMWPVLWNSKGSNAEKCFFSTQDTHGIDFNKGVKDLVLKTLAEIR